jgi:ribose/xylose/arabinose/galactoside ABC-type transport system permease subunit
MRNRLQVQLFLLDNLIWVIVLLFFLINAFVTPKFATYDNLVNIFYHSAIMSMLVLAQGLVMIIGHLDLSIESTLAFAPGIAMLLALKWIPGGLDPVTCIFLTLAVGALVGFFNGFCIAKIGVNPFLQSLSMLIMLRGLVTTQPRSRALLLNSFPMEGIARFTALPIKGVKKEAIVTVINAYFLIDAS